jgi:hypothetical protein
MSIPRLDNPSDRTIARVFVGFYIVAAGFAVGMLIYTLAAGILTWPLWIALTIWTGAKLLEFRRAFREGKELIK